MDLTRLYNLTTPELRQEAERLGVRDTYAMSRGQLIQAIRGQTGDAQPEGLLGKVLGFAKWAIQTTAAATPRSEADDARRAGRSSEVPVPRVASEKAAAGSAAEPATAAEPVTAAAEAAFETRRAGKTEAGEPTMGPTTPIAPSAPLLAFGGEQPEEEGGTLSGSSSRPPAGVFSRGVSSFEEPFPTRTMARILADQGHFRRSLAIYAKLLAERPDDRELSAEAEEVRARSRARRSELQ
jgi:hypothetical protein